MPKAVEQFYVGLLSDPAAPYVLQRRIYDFAKKRKSAEVLAALARHPGLDPKLDPLLGELSYAKVKAAWALRPGRSLEVLEDLACTDTRAAVLADLAARLDLSDKAYETMAKRKHLKVDWVLLGNARVPLGVKKEVARNLGENLSRDGWSILSKLQAVLADQTELHDSLAAGSDNVKILELVADTPDISEETQDRIAQVLIKKITDMTKAKGTTAMYMSWQDAHTVVSILSKLAGNPGLIPAVASTLSQALDGVSTGQGHVDQSIAAAVATLTVVKNSTGKKANPLAQARTSADQRVLQKIAADAVNSRNNALAVALVTNPSAGPDLVELVAPIVPRQALERLVSTRAGELDVIVRLLAPSTWHVTDRLLAATGSPQDVLVTLAEYLGRKGQALSQSLLSSSYVTPEIAKRLPMPALAALAAADNLSQPLCKAATEALSQGFGLASSRWEIFETLGDQFEGSLQELLESVLMLAGEGAEEDMDGDIASPVPSALSEEVVSEEVVSEEVVSDPVSIPEQDTGEVSLETPAATEKVLTGGVTPGRSRKVSPKAQADGQLSLI